jgi:hypothetical protein
MIGDWAFQADWLLWTANKRSNFHHGLIVCRGIRFRDQFICYFLKFFLTKCCIYWSPYIKKSTQESIYISINDCLSLIESKRTNCRCSVSSDTLSV